MVLCRSRAGTGKRSHWPFRAEEGHTPFFELERSSVPWGRETAGGGQRESQQEERNRVSSGNGGRGETEKYEGGRVHKAWRWMRDRKGAILTIGGRIFPSGLR